MGMNRPNLPSLTSLRFFAALLVVIFHYNIKSDHTLRFPGGVADFGYEAVTFFFVLSGFVLTYVHVEIRNREILNLSARRFMIKRIARIAPMYFVGLALSAPFFIASYVHHHELSRAGFVSALVLTPAAMQAWYPPAAIAWNAPAWSLSVELFLYGSLIPLVPAIGRTDRIMFLIAAYLMVIFVAILDGFFFSNELANNMSDAWNNFRAFFPLWHLPKFIFGVALARLVISGNRASGRVHETLLVVGLAAISMIVFFRSQVSLLSNDVVLVAAFGTLVYGAAGATGPFSRILSTPSLVLWGDASYSIYIIHAPLISWWTKASGLVMSKIELPSIVNFCCYLVVVVSVSIWMLKHFEKPMQRWLLERMTANSSGTITKHTKGVI
jgi:peptidoglycan/LPS O-acetylase OafA/YrhL